MIYEKMPVITFDFSNDYVMINPEACILIDIKKGDKIRFIALQEKVYLCKSDEGSSLSSHNSDSRLKTRSKSILIYMISIFSFSKKLVSMPLRRNKAELNGEKIYEVVIPTRNVNIALRNIKAMSRLKMALTEA